MSVTVSELNVYPVKSCKGISVKEALISPKGFFAWDRQFMVQRDNGKFITQRQISKLALIQPTLPPSVLETGTFTESDTLTLSAPGMPDLTVPLHISKINTVVVDVWGWQGQAHDEGDAAASWLTTFLDQPARLVRYLGKDDVQGSVRAVDPEGEWTRAPHLETQFSDAFPFLITSQSSLDDLNKHILERNAGKGEGVAALPMNRFRPNIVISGSTLQPWAEDSFSRVRIGSDVILNVVKPCDRCKVPSIDQVTGVAGDEPTDTLHAIRSGQVLGWLDPKPFKVSVFFGVNAVVEGLENGLNNMKLSAGQEVQVLSTLNGPPKPLSSVAA